MGHTVHFQCNFMAESLLKAPWEHLMSFIGTTAQAGSAVMISDENLGNDWFESLPLPEGL
jgi:hypothetical protein